MAHEKPTADGCFEYMALSFEADPVLKAQYEREAEPFREAVEKAERLERIGLRVIQDGKVTKR